MCVIWNFLKWGFFLKKKLGFIGWLDRFMFLKLIFFFSLFFQVSFNFYWLRITFFKVCDETIYTQVFTIIYQCGHSWLFQWDWEANVIVKQICFLFFDALRDQGEPIPKFLEWSGSRESFGTFAFLLIYYFIFEEVSE